MSGIISANPFRSELTIAISPCSRHVRSLLHRIRFKGHDKSGSRNRRTATTPCETDKCGHEPRAIDAALSDRSDQKNEMNMTNIDGTTASWTKSALGLSIRSGQKMMKQFR